MKYKLFILFAIISVLLMPSLSPVYAQEGNETWHDTAEWGFSMETPPVDLIWIFFLVVVGIVAIFSVFVLRVKTNA